MYSFFGVGTRLRTGEVNPLFGFENVIEAGLVGAGSNVYSSIRETMEEKKGKYGLVVPFEQDYGKSKENAVALYGVLDRILKDDSLRKDLQKKGRERFVSCFDISYFARFFYQKVISLI